MRQISDPIELMIAQSLNMANIEYIHESERTGIPQLPGQRNLDFEIPAWKIFIEVKQFHTDRIADQIKGFENVIVIQGIEAARFFCQMVKAYGPAKSPA